MDDTRAKPDRVAIVLIGRNEGERLMRALDRLTTHAGPVVYVDSGSTDGSPEEATKRGLNVVHLDLARPFTAARARDEGVKAALRMDADVVAVQFIDGDCELQPSWLPVAAEVLRSHPEAAVVCGRRRESNPNASTYNRLLDAEWATPIGDAKACHGDALVRLEAFLQVGGFRREMIAGEEPELCVRLRSAGWKIYRIDAEMTTHDADMHRFSQWWRRAVRAGHAYAEGFALHGLGPTRHNMREVFSTLVWTVVLPMLGLTMALSLSVWVLIAMPLAYGLQVVRLAVKHRSRLGSWSVAWAFAGLAVLAKFAHLCGMLTYLCRRVRGSTPTLIEYKHPARSGS